eukprot:gene11259-4078_t
MSSKYYVGISQGGLGITRKPIPKEFLGFYTENLRVCYAIFMRWKNKDGEHFISFLHYDERFTLKKIKDHFKEDTLDGLFLFKNEEYSDNIIMEEFDFICNDNEKEKESYEKLLTKYKEIHKKYRDKKFRIFEGKTGYLEPEVENIIEKQEEEINELKKEIKYLKELYFVPPSLFDIRLGKYQRLIRGKNDKIIGEHTVIAEKDYYSPEKINRINKIEPN